MPYAVHCHASGVPTKVDSLAEWATVAFAVGPKGEAFSLVPFGGGFCVVCRWKGKRAMDFPRGLLVILALLSLGMCLEGMTLFSSDAGVSRLLVLGVLLGRIMAIVGIIMRNRVGWFLALGFFAVIVALNLAAGGAAVFGVFVPGLCLIYLLFIKGEFD